MTGTTRVGRGVGLWLLWLAAVAGTAGLVLALTAGSASAEPCDKAASADASYNICDHFDEVGDTGGFDPHDVGKAKLSYDNDGDCYWVIEEPGGPYADFFEARDAARGMAPLCETDVTDDGCVTLESVTLPDPEPHVDAGIGSVGLPTYLQIRYDGDPDFGDTGLAHDWSPADGLITAEGDTPCGYLQLRIQAVHEIDWGDGETSRKVKHGEPYPGGPAEITHVYEEWAMRTIEVETTWILQYGFDGENAGALGELPEQRAHAAAEEALAQARAEKEAADARAEEARQALEAAQGTEAGGVEDAGAGEGVGPGDGEAEDAGQAEQLEQAEQAAEAAEERLAEAEEAVDEAQEQADAKLAEFQGMLAELAPPDGLEDWERTRGTLDLLIYQFQGMRRG